MRRRPPTLPRRTCVGCRRVGLQSGFVRVAATRGGELGVGPGAPGRGAYLCAGSLDCFERATRRGALARALRRPLVIDELAAIRARLFD